MADPIIRALTQRGIARTVAASITANCNRPVGDRPCFLDRGHDGVCKSLADILLESI